MQSVQRVVSDGTLQIVDLSITYFDRSEISVFVNSAPYTDWHWASDVEDRIIFNSPIPAGVEVLIKRTTDISKLRHYFSKGSAFTAEALDEDLQQVLHIAQEATETNLAGDFYNDIDMHGYRVKNIGQAVDDSDVLTLRQYKQDAQGAFVARNQAEQFKNEAASYANSAQTSANKSAVSAQDSLAAADSTKTYAASAAQSATNAAASAATASSSANTAITKANEVVSYAASAANSATTAMNEANRAKAEADRASSYATGLSSGIPAAAQQLGSGVDLNTIQTPGFYFQPLDSYAASGKNYPIAQAGSLVVLRGASVTQLYYAYGGGNDPRAFFRTFYSYEGLWSPWREVFHSGNISTANAGTATKLQTPRTINGTSFDGTADITTAKWGAARTITIGNTGKSFDGSENVSWSLDEIGAARFGFLASGINLNNVVSPGFYRLQEYIANAPAGVTYGQLIVARGGGDNILQIVTGYDNGEIYWRQGNPPEVGGIGSWSAWYKFFHSNNLADAFKGTNQSLSGTGYQRLPGGLIIQWGSGNTSRYQSLHIAFPTAFPTAPLVAQATVLGVDTLFTSVESLTATNITVRAFDRDGLRPYGVSIYWIAIGY